MADIRAFRGFRYDLGRVGKLADVIAPPYDVIDVALQDQLYAASPYNAVRVEFTREDPDHKIDKYSQATRTLAEWLNADLLKQDSARMVYALEQEYQANGQTHRRRGFFARVRLEPFGTGRIFPHEQTLSGPKADRFRLYEATQFNLSPIFGLYPEEGPETIFDRIEPLIRNQPPIVATDHLGVIHRFWPLQDSSLISYLVGQMSPKPIFIADGHHRYETGLKYRDQLQETGETLDAEHPAQFCLMFLVSMRDPGLLILPTHRLITMPGPVDGVALRASLAPFASIVAEFGTDAQACADYLEIEGTQSHLGFALPARPDHAADWFVVQLTDANIMATLCPQQSAEWRSLAVSWLHQLVLGQCWPRAFGTTPTCQYVHQLHEVQTALELGQAQAACLVPPVSMDHVEWIAGQRETMPPKSTYFFPKIPTGLVFHSLKKD